MWASFTYLSLKKRKRMGAVDVAGRLSISFFTSETALSTFTYCDIMDSTPMHMVVTRPHLLMGMYNIYSWIHTYTNRQIHMHLNALIYKHVNVHVRMFMGTWALIYRGQYIYFYVSIGMCGDTFSILICCKFVLLIAKWYREKLVLVHHI